MDFCVKALEGAFNKEKALLAIVGTFYNQCDSTDQCGVHGVLEHGVNEDGEPVGEDEVGDEESPAHRPQQQQDVERLEGSLTMLYRCNSMLKESIMTLDATQESSCSSVSIDPETVRTSVTCKTVPFKWESTCRWCSQHGEVPYRNIFGTF